MDLKAHSTMQTSRAESLRPSHAPMVRMAWTVPLPWFNFSAPLGLGQQKMNVHWVQMLHNLFYMTGKGDCTHGNGIILLCCWEAEILDIMPFWATRFPVQSPNYHQLHNYPFGHRTFPWNAVKTVVKTPQKCVGNIFDKQDSWFWLWLRIRV